MNYRLYSFVANHYLSPLQCGLQTAHVVSELSMLYKPDGSPQHRAYVDWANNDKTIIICGAGNHQGVRDCMNELMEFGHKLDLLTAIFHEDEASMNGMATACGVIVPQRLYDCEFVKPDPTGEVPLFQTGFWRTPDTMDLYEVFPLDSVPGKFISYIKSFRLA